MLTSFTLGVLIVIGLCGAGLYLAYRNSPPFRGYIKGLLSKFIK